MNNCYVFIDTVGKVGLDQLWLLLMSMCLKNIEVICKRAIKERGVPKDVYEKLKFGIDQRIFECLVSHPCTHTFEYWTVINAPSSYPFFKIFFFYYNHV